MNEDENLKAAKSDVMFTPEVLYEKQNAAKRKELLNGLSAFATGREGDSLADKIDSSVDFEAFFDIPADSLMKKFGIDEKTATLVTLINRIAGRIEEIEDNGIGVYSPEEIKPYLIEYFGNTIHEKLAIYYLGADMQIIKKTLVGGRTNKIVPNLNALAKEQLPSTVTCAVVIHNHPSGNACPSDYDDVATANLVQHFDSMGIKFHDHLIVGEKDVFSYRATGKLDEIKDAFYKSKASSTEKPEEKF